MRVFLTGGSGYIGRPLVDLLLGQGHEVIATVRQGTQRPLTVHSALTVVNADLFDSYPLARAMEGCDAVIHLVGIIREEPRRGITMTRMHVTATESVIKAATVSKVKRFLHMSALGSRENATSGYHRSKWQGEQVVKDSPIPFTIFRPSVVFGEGGPGPNFVAQLADLIQKLPVCPIIGDGQFLLQPVSIRTLTEAFALALDSPAAMNVTYDVGGPEVLTYVEIMRRIAAHLGRRFTPVPVPFWFMELASRYLHRFPSFPITPDQLTMLKEGNVCDDTKPLYRDFPLTRIPFLPATQG